MDQQMETDLRRQQDAITQRDFRKLAAVVLARVRFDPDSGELIEGDVMRDDLVFESPAKLRTNNATARDFTLTVQREAHLAIGGGEDPWSLSWGPWDDRRSLQDVLTRLSQAAA